MDLASLADGRLGAARSGGSVGGRRRGSPSWLALVDPIQATSLFASIVFLLASGPRLRELLLFLAGAVGFALEHQAWLRLFSFRGVPFEQSALVAAGLASLLAIAARAAASERGSEARAWFHLAVMLPAFGMAMGLALDFTVPLHGWAWDPSFWGWTPGSVSRASSSGAWPPVTPRC